VFRTCGVSIAGPAHAESNLPSQDALGIYGWRNGKLAIVCDGMGSKPLSRLGARVAVQSVRRTLKTTDIKPGRLLIQEIYRDWLMNQPARTASDAASTLLFATIRFDGLVFLAQLGDGMVMYRAGGQFDILTPNRTGFGNQTTALGISKAWSDWQTAEIRLTRPGDGVIMMTDGISDDLQIGKLENFFKSVTTSTRVESKRRALDRLKKQLLDWPTPGHSDDKTIAVIVKV
jgi:serine/threonine protein phosphatase PrpC